jgi:hypothetical protein
MASIEGEVGHFTGRVTSISVGGFGANSPEIMAYVKATIGGIASFVFDSDTSPQIFSAMAALLIAAYQKRLPVTLTYVPRRGGNLKIITAALP